MRENATSALQSYITDTFAQEKELLHEVRSVGESLVPGMQISPAEGKLLQVLVSMVSARNILEIGTFVGYSTLWMADALPADGTLTTLEANDKNAELAQGHVDRSPHANKIQIIQGKALDVLVTLQGKQSFYDAVFIDAAKSEYAQYLDLVEPLVRAGGLVIGDNSLLFGHMIGQPMKEVSEEAKASMGIFNSRLGDESKYNGVLVPTEEGMTIARKLP